MLEHAAVLESWARRQPRRPLEDDHDLQGLIDRRAVDSGNGSRGGVGALSGVGLVEHGLGQLELGGSAAGLEDVEVAIEAGKQASELALRPGDESARGPICPSPPHPVGVAGHVAGDPVGAVDDGVHHLNQHRQA